MRARTQLLEEKGFILYKNQTNKQTNTNSPVAENGLAGQEAHITYDDKPAQDCQHKEIINGANEEGNEMTQVGQINQ